MAWCSFLGLATSSRVNISFSTTKVRWELVRVVPACNPNTQEVETEESRAT